MCRLVYTMKDGTDISVDEKSSGGYIISAAKNPGPEQGQDYAVVTLKYNNTIDELELVSSEGLEKHEVVLLFKYIENHVQDFLNTYYIANALA